MVKPIPDGYTSITPYLIFKNAAAAIELYKKAFGAKEIYRLTVDGRIGHAEMQIGNSRVMLADENPRYEAFSPSHFNGSPVQLVFYVEDVDHWARQASAAGMKAIRAVETQFYGDRTGRFIDPFGYQWTIATRVEDLSPEEIIARMPNQEQAA